MFSDMKSQVTISLSGGMVFHPSIGLGSDILNLSYFLHVVVDPIILVLERVTPHGAKLTRGQPYRFILKERVPIECYINNIDEKKALHCKSLIDLELK